MEFNIIYILDFFFLFFINMKQLFTISGRYAATEDISITPQVGLS